MKNRLYLSLVFVVFLCLAGWTAHAQLQRTGTVRQTWEYKYLYYRAPPLSSWGEDGKALSGPPSIRGRANELGAEGWELVSVVSSGTDFAYWFKRPK